MNFENLLIAELDGGVLLLTINRPQALNALNKKTMQELRTFFEDYLPSVLDCRGVIVTGAGEKSFVAGADIKEFSGLDQALATQMAQYGQDTFFAIERSQVPVIAAVNGFALGGGCELAMACHLRIAGEKAKFGQPEVSLGIIAGYGGTQRLTQLVGKAKSLELHLTGDMIDANEAYRLGLANYVVPAGTEVAKAQELLAKIASKAPIAVAKVIGCVNAYYEVGTDGFGYEVREFGNCTVSDDFKEGAAAFVERRKANFRGK